MERRQILRASLALCGGLTLSGLGASQGAAEVIDLGAGGSDLRVQSGVLDFGKTIPARQTREDPETETDPSENPDAMLWRASYGSERSGRGPTGRADIEDLVLDVGDDYLRHPGLKAAGLTGTEAGIAGGTALLGQKLLEAVFGEGGGRVRPLGISPLAVSTITLVPSGTRV